MEDSRIIALYFERSEDALIESSRKYGAYLRLIAERILKDHAFAEECVNDALLSAWESIPPASPEKLGAWLGKVIRNIALNRLEKSRAGKRGGGETDAAFHELEACIRCRGADIGESLAFKSALNAFLASLSAENRRIFIQRYWYFLSAREIAAENGMGQSKVKTSLMRTRNKLKDYLEKEGLFL